MQGFISGITKLKNEDLIVQVITHKHFLRLYRFYGARHSIISIGRKIDFNVEYQGQFLPKLRNVMQLGFSWEGEYTKLYYWQRFMGILNAHLRDTEEIPSFYFEMLDSAGLCLTRQAPNRVLIESYAKLLAFEGRLNLGDECFICQKPLDAEVAVARGYLCAHNACLPSHAPSIDKEKFFDFLRTARAIGLDENEVENLLSVLFMGV